MAEQGFFWVMLPTIASAFIALAVAIRVRSERLAFVSGAGLTILSAFLLRILSGSARLIPSHGDRFAFADLLAHGSRLLADGFRQILLSPVASIMVGVICAFLARRKNLGELRSHPIADYLATFVFLGLMLGVMLAGYAVFRWLWFFEWMDD